MPLQWNIFNNPKRNTLTHHSGYTRGDDKKEKVIKIEKTFFQEVRDIVGTGLEFVNYKNYKSLIQRKVSKV